VRKCKSSATQHINTTQLARPDEFKRLTGISKEDFDILYRKVAGYIQSQKAIKPL